MTPAHSLMTLNITFGLFVFCTKIFISKFAGDNLILQLGCSTSECVYCECNIAYMLKLNTSNETRLRCCEVKTVFFSVAITIFISRLCPIPVLCVRVIHIQCDSYYISLIKLVLWCIHSCQLKFPSNSSIWFDFRMPSAHFLDKQK